MRSSFNLKDFPDEGAATYGIEVVHPDTFLLELLGDDADAVVAALERETAAFGKPPETMTQFLATLTVTVPIFANLTADAFSDPHGTLSGVPALVGASQDEELAGFGAPGDLTNPAAVALAWWSGLLHDLDRACF